MKHQYYNKLLRWSLIHVLALMSYGPDFVQALFENRDIDHSNSVYTQLVSILKQPQFAFTEKRHFL